MMNRDGGSQSDLPTCSVAEKGNWLGLTFDDGPDDHYTAAILDILHAHHVTAGFFCIGNQVQNHPNVLKRIVESGHIVANHTWSHPHLTKVTQKDLVSELDRTSKII